MKKLNVIIIILVIVIAMLCVGILFTSGVLNQTQNMKTIALSSTCTIDVIESDTNITLLADNIKLYNDTKNGIEIVSFNSADAEAGNGNILGGAVAFAAIRDGLTIGENMENVNGFTLYKCDGYYSAKLASNATHDNIVVVCKNLDLLKKIVSSAKFTNNSTANDTVNTVSSNTKAPNTTNTSTSSSDKPDGVSDEDWAFHESQMQYREENPYAAADGSRFPTIEERDTYQAQISSQGSSQSSSAG